MKAVLREVFGDRGNWATVLTVAAALVPALVASDWIGHFALSAGLLGLGLLYILIGTAGFNQVIQRGGLLWPAVYFAVQFCLAMLIVVLTQGFNLTIIIILPLAAHTVTVLPRRGQVLVNGLLLLAMLIMFLNITTPLVAAEATLSIGAGLVFVIVFTQMAYDSQRARAEVERLAAELTQANQRLREYSVQVEELATARERNRLAREIHDGLGHYLTVINMQIQAARAVQSSDPARAAEAMGKAGAMTVEALADIRRSVASLRASPAEDRPLETVLRDLCDQVQAGGIQTAFETLGQARPLSAQARLTLYRAAQEALTNVQKHAHASAVTVTLDYREPGRTGLCVRDNGTGASQADGGFGLLGLRERTALLNGQVQVTSAPGQGFQLNVQLPE